jgi:hypothetical protein
MINDGFRSDKLKKYLFFFNFLKIGSVSLIPTWMIIQSFKISRKSAC